MSCSLFLTIFAKKSSHKALVRERIPNIDRLLLVRSCLQNFCQCRYLQPTYRISANSFCGRNFFFNLEIVVNSNNWRKYQFFHVINWFFLREFPELLIGGNYSRAKTIFWRMVQFLSPSYKPLQILLNKIYCQNFVKVAFSCIFCSTTLGTSLPIHRSEIWIDHHCTYTVEIHPNHINLKLDFSSLVKNTWIVHRLKK